MMEIIKMKINKKSDNLFPDFPKNWSKMKNHPETLKPENIWDFLNSVKVTEEEVKKGRPIKKMFEL